jgi:hypothetical protein
MRRAVWRAREGYFLRNHWVPMPMAADRQALNRNLLEDCRADESRSGRARLSISGHIPD